MAPTLWHAFLWLLLVALQGPTGGEPHPPPTTAPTPSHCRGCPYFLNTPTHIVTAVGADVNLTCGVRMLGDRQVSWIRKRDLHVLTTNTFTYTTESRFNAVHVNNSPYWVLSVTQAELNDSGVYECQVAAQPKIYKQFQLDVVVPKATILGSRAVFMKAGSDLNVTCRITGATEQAAPVTWYHTNPTTRSSNNVVQELNSGNRGGVQLVTDRRAGTSWLLVTQATWRDAGNYTCAPDHATPASVVVHVLDEESPAAMQPHLQAGSSPSPSPSSTSSSSSSAPSSVQVLTLGLACLLRLYLASIQTRGRCEAAGLSPNTGAVVI
ncbi:contactin-5-like [Portunus trituberculatus]|uniref:contactin-5-like n=1 Tax=Portunus trituberculatus TaxID=210409 RepID=UPI001E1CE569|nr:contactin-5-like [Portunus trituberculatus]XP_045104492.1 contactin-5-like [Portunus trituberculatus]XP_045104493.1 contactin-5-like [Portunus trituberculatus]